MSEDLEKIWQKALGELEVVLSKANFTTWFRGTFILEKKKGIFTIGVPTFFIEDWLSKKYIKEIKTALQKQVGDEISEIRFKVATSPKLDTKKPEKEKVIHSPVDNSEKKIQEEKTVEKVKNDSLNDYYVFSNFVVGTSNQLAHAAAKSVSKKPGKSYNPLFIYGDSGLGKTHLIQAIGHEAITNNPKTKVLYVSCETFINDFIDSVQGGKARDFKNLYRNVDILLIDDIQFLGGKEQTQEEFFHTFNHLHQKNKQVVLTADRIPKEIKGLEKRLITRFEWGMVADIQMPDFETRRAILQSKCQEKEVNIDDDVINYIAENIESNIRELEGALTKVFAFCELTNESPSMSIVEKVLSESVQRGHKRQVISSEKVLKVIEKFYNVSIDDISGKKRNRELIKPRQISMYLLKNMVGLSYPEIGRELGGKDHTTVMYGCKMISKDISSSAKIKDEIELIKEYILG